MQLISTEDVAKLIGFNKFGGRHISKIVMSLLQIDRINNIYSKHNSKGPIDFLNSVINDTGINYEIDFNDIEKIPKEGPFVIIANHPFGGIEGLILMDTILPIRPDFKLIANFLLQRIEPIRDYLFPVNPFETYKNAKSSYTGLRAGLSHLSNGNPVGIFPAGEVSAYRKNVSGITDRLWKLSIIKLIKISNVPVIPVYFEGKNSSLFYLLGRIHPLLRTAKIPSEILNKRNVKIKLRIGKPLSVEDQNNFKDIIHYAQYLRKITYSLATQSVQTSNINKTSNKQEIISKPVNKILLLEDIANISEKQIMLRWHNFTVYCAPTCLIPNIAKEIGRLREITFREVGEGTNQSFDIDEFDNFYHQLFIWNDIEKEIAGGYRLGKGFDIINERGINGFYINTLFTIGNEMKSMLNKSIELGRSFIIKKYQRKPWSLYLLWKGILNFLKNNTHYRYLIGPISISSRYSEISKHVMVEFIRKNYFNYHLADRFTPKNPYLYKNGSSEMRYFLNSAADLNSLDHIIKDIETAETKMPVLLKKYLLLGGKIAGFNFDPEFNHCLDCLLILDLKDVPGRTIELLSKERQVI